MGVLSLKDKDWQDLRVVTANALEALSLKLPNDLIVSVLIDGFYAQQLLIDQLVNQLKIIQEQSNLSRGAEDNTKRLISEVKTFAGRVGGD